MILRPASPNISVLTRATWLLCLIPTAASDNDRIECLGSGRVIGVADISKDAISNTTKACTQCKLSSSTCTTSRVQLRRGRRPKAKPLGPHSSVRVWEVESVEHTSLKPLQNEAVARAHAQRSSTAATGIRSNSSPSYQDSTLDLHRYQPPFTE